MNDVPALPQTGLSDRVHGDLSVAAAGTPAYMAPEQWRSLGSAGAPADVYAVGVTLFQLATGELPFADRQRYRGRLPPAVQAVASADSAMPELVLRLFHEHVVPLRCADLGAALPDELDGAIAACLAKDPAARPSAAQLRAALVACHERHVGAYPRALPTSLAASAIGENNRAVSYFVMGEAETARTILDAVLAADATALHPWLNRAALAIADGELEPTAAAAELANFVLVANPGMAADADVAAFRAEVGRFHLPHAAPVIALATAPGRLVSLTAAGRVTLWDPEPRVLADLPDASGVAIVGADVAVASARASSSSSRTAAASPLPPTSPPSPLGRDSSSAATPTAG